MNTLYTKKNPAVAAIVYDYVEAFESLREDTMEHLLSFFDDNAQFVDPFNDVTGVAVIRRIFEEMFAKTDNPRFHIEDVFIQESKAILTWKFYYQFKNALNTVEVYGSTLLMVNDDGKVTLHRDFWDPCQGVYEHIPLLGAFFRWIRRRAAL